MLHLALLAALAVQPASDKGSYTQEELAVGTVRSIISAQAYHQRAFAQLGYACSIERLVEVQALLDTLSQGKTFDGYVFRVWCESTSAPQTTYRASAVPAKRVKGALLTVCTDETNVPRTVDGDVSACFARGTPAR